MQRLLLHSAYMESDALELYSRRGRIRDPSPPTTTFNDNDSDLNSFMDAPSTSSSDDPGFFLLGNIGARIRRWLLGNQVPELVEQLAQELVEDSDLSVSLEDSSLDDVPKRGGYSRYHKRFLSEVVDECKIAIEGISVETQANRLVARRWLSKRMVAQGMRPSHIKVILPLAVEMVFVLNEYEIIAHQLRSTKAILDRKALATTVYTPRHRPNVFNWLGAKRAQPVIADG